MDKKQNISPLPWSISGINPGSICDTNCRTFATDMNHTTAAYIVRAVNAHEALVDALRDIVANIDKGGCPVRGSVMHEAARAALALADGKAVTP